MDRLLQKIRDADAIQIEDILDAAIKRKRALYPDWEILYYARKKGKRTLCRRWHPCWKEKENKQQ